MYQKLSDIIAHNTTDEIEKSFSLHDSINKYLFHWPLFIIGIAICSLGALLYFKNSNPTYSITASIIIKDEKKQPDQKNNFQELYTSNSPKLVENEIEVLKSRNLLRQVVSDLKLWVYYEGLGSWKMNFYKKNPVNLIIIDSSNNFSQFFDIKIKDHNSFYVKNKKGNFKQFLFNQVLKSGNLTWKLIPNENIENFKGAEIKIIVKSPEETAEQYQNTISIEQSNKLASTINLSIKDEIEQRGKDILNDLIGVYVETSINEKNRNSKKTLDFINDRISSLAAELNNSEKNIEGYRSSKGITDISSQSDVYLQNVQANDNKLNEVNIQLNVMNGIDNYLKSPQNLQNVPSTLGINDPMLNSSIEKLSLLQLQREKLLATTPETNPDFEQIDRQIKTTKRVIKESIENIRSSLELTKNKLLSFNSKYESSIRDIPVQERQLVDKTRQKSIKENLYVYLLQKREEVAVDYSSLLSDARVVDYAYTITKSSRKPVIYGIAFLLAILLPSTLIFARNHLTNRITSGDEIKIETELPILAEVSHNSSSLFLIVPNKNNTSICHDFRKLRTELILLKDKMERGWVTLVTSSIGNEGKTFVSSNLGNFLAASGKKTIILEMNWRNPKILATFNKLNDQPGISDYLVEELSVDDIIQKIPTISNLYVIGCGLNISNSSEIMENVKIELLIRTLQSTFDYIIIDSPGINIVPDAKLLARNTDTILFVVKQAYTFKHMLNFIKLLSKEKHFANMKIVFNDLKIGKYNYGNIAGNNYFKTLGHKGNFFDKLKFQNFLNRF